jgi:GNAT superfamily N-acetyltransferase
MRIRQAELSDIESMVRLSEAFRMSLTSYSPIFWRKAEASSERQATWFRVLVPLEDTIALVAEIDSELRGFIIGRLQEAPPVYEPGGPICLVDDFCVTSDSEWAIVGSKLLEAVEREARARGAVLAVVICPHLARAKGGFLAERGFEVTAEWHVRGLGDPRPG